MKTVCKADFLYPESMKDHSKMLSSTRSYLSVPSQTFVAGDSELFNSRENQMLFLNKGKMFLVVSLYLIYVACRG